MDNPIGIFDSGLGGLTVVREIVKQLPQENIIYFGDTARVPYGTKSAETVTRFALQNARFLGHFNIKVLVVACHTASALSLTALRANFAFPVVGVIRPGCSSALKQSVNRIGVIGTEATISSRAYQKMLIEMNGNVEVIGQSCPLLVPLVEEGWLTNEITRLIILEYLNVFRKKTIDTLILGCTHYPLLKPILQKELGSKVSLIDTAEATTVEVKTVLEQKELISLQKTNGKQRFFVSDMPQKFSKVASMFFGKKIGEVKRIDIEEY